MQEPRGRLLENVSLSNYTSWRVGGPAQRLYIPKNSDDLINFLKQLPPKEPVLFLGLGSNTLIRDGGIKATVVITQGALSKLELLEPTVIRAEAGVASPAFARFSARKNLNGAEFLAGIPGTIGGALAMNAGCNGSETWEIVKAVETINRHGEKKLRRPSNYQIAYRSVNVFPDEFYLAAHFQLNPGNKEESLEKIRSLLAHRTATQPTNEPSCGSVFRNPENDYAARLIESSGLKGLKIGGASVSTKHANFIVNENQATAADIEALIEKISGAVFKKHHIQLIREVHIIGDKL
ncbi:UDP-N-acetylenolpyruvoylglucosamine reductase [Candidatus Rickettsiella viridis]|uniref:UDP-N-acetylenolpyruvoylglucosamine reductase n=1 Tax=Candidatus Rickettsiella viridis TaxID=676208 RepID=A0A2Z5V7T1_9COXI|nr:UDP-N-acetylmuramate dehydrogenase [Candidatus Rickettsiella viridis]BBB15747.1 UDP-N-acetylenolpyruvoylglucosamine reductase [Candidatus Rickettsiella viridis]